METRKRPLTATIAAVTTVAVTAVIAVTSVPSAAYAAQGGSSRTATLRSPTERGIVYEAVCSGPRRPDEMACFALVQKPERHRPGAATPHAGHGGLGPAEIQSAYRLPSATAGAGQTVAVVAAFDDPNAEDDLAVYRAEYGLPPCTTGNGCFRKVNQDGAAGPLPAPNSAWAAEIALDVQMVAAACPNCGILLVEARTPSTGDLMAGVDTAVGLGAKVISNSYGTFERAALSEFSARLDHPGVATVFASGDGGYGVAFPASSPYVTSVGGTSLEKAGNDRGWTESVWSGAGSGCSANESKPPFQTDPGCGNRTVADVAAVADPKTGLAVYNTFGRYSSGWGVFGGTSAAAPLIAGVYALAGTPLDDTYPNSYPYLSAAGALFDVTSGGNGECPVDYLCQGRVGYDGPTGLGTPNGVAAFRPAGEYGRVTGTVTETATGRPLPGVKITAVGARAVTDRDGRYALPLPVGRHEVHAAGPGYRTGTAAGVEVARDGPATVDFALEPVPAGGTPRDGGRR